MVHTWQVYVMYETTYSTVCLKGALNSRPVIGQLTWFQMWQDKQVKQKQYVLMHWSLASLLQPLLFCNNNNNNIMSSTHKWKTRILTVFKPTHALQTSQYIKEPTVDYSEWWWLFWFVPSLGNNKDLLSCMNHIQPPTDCFFLLCLLHRPWRTQGSHLWHW